MPRHDGHTQDNCPIDAQEQTDSWASTLAAHKDRTRTRILQAAATLLDERGAAGLAMTTLARRAGIARATLYNYFPDTGRVLEALVETEVAAFLRDLDRQLASITDAGRQLDTAIDALIDWVARQAQRRPARAKGAGPVNSARAVDIAGIHRPLAAIEDRIAAVLATARDAGALPAHCDPALAARFAVALAFGVRAQLTGPGSHRTTTALREFLRNGLAPS